MNRASTDRRVSKREGSKDRRGRQQIRALNPEKGKRIARARRIWKENRKENGAIRG